MFPLPALHCFSFCFLRHKIHKGRQFKGNVYVHGLPFETQKAHREVVDRAGLGRLLALENELAEPFDHALLQKITVMSLVLFGSRRIRMMIRDGIEMEKRSRKKEIWKRKRTVPMKEKGALTTHLLCSIMRSELGRSRELGTKKWQKSIRKCMGYCSSRMPRHQLASYQYSIFIRCIFTIANFRVSPHSQFSFPSLA